MLCAEIIHGDSTVTISPCDDQSKNAETKEIAAPADAPNDEELLKNCTSEAKTNARGDREFQFKMHMEVGINFLKRNARVLQ